ncbi:MAG: DUF1566 domain-containing protein [Xanthomonadales bacterium]|nr:DUF1566 domain-containing protein [Xanthomonadales bacterium]
MTHSETATLEAQAAPPSLFIHVAGDVNIHAGTRRDPGLSILGALPISGTIAQALRAVQDGQRVNVTEGPATAAAAHAATGAPSIIIRDPAQPLKAMADGHQVDARETVTDHVALIFPESGIWVHPTTLARDGKAYANQAAVEAAAKELRVLGHDDWHLAPDTVYDRHVIDRRFHKPAADPNLYPHLLLTDWYWTSTIAPWSAASAFYVPLGYGGVSYGPRDYSGFGLACRRARQ